MDTLKITVQVGLSQILLLDACMHLSSLVRFPNQQELKRLDFLYQNARSLRKLRSLLDATTHLYKRSCPSVCPLVRPSVTCCFQTTNMVIFDRKKSYDIEINESTRMNSRILCTPAPRGTCFRVPRRRHRNGKYLILSFSFSDSKILTFDAWTRKTTSSHSSRSQTQNHECLCGGFQGGLVPYRDLSIPFRSQGCS